MKIIECPRDAMQGLAEFVPTAEKIRYIGHLLQVGFDTIDFGSFVSPKAIPQMRDTAQVLEGLQEQGWLSGTASNLLAIVANVRGAEQATAFEQIGFLGFPLSVSETFQQRNTNKSIAEAFQMVADMAELCATHRKTLVVYLSMGFGNPYSDPYSPALLTDFSGRLYEMGIRVISLADTVGTATPRLISDAFQALIPAFPDVEFGAHLHCRPEAAHERLQAAWQAGCRRIDTAMGGMGGCPMANDTLTGNLATEALVAWADQLQIELPFNREALRAAQQLHAELFSHAV